MSRLSGLARSAWNPKSMLRRFGVYVCVSQAAQYLLDKEQGCPGVVLCRIANPHRRPRPQSAGRRGQLWTGLNKIEARTRRRTAKQNTYPSFFNCGASRTHRLGTSMKPEATDTIPRHELSDLDQTSPDSDQRINAEPSARGPTSVNRPLCSITRTAQPKAALW